MRRLRRRLRKAEGPTQEARQAAAGDQDLVGRHSRWRVFLYPRSRQAQLTNGAAELAFCFNVSTVPEGTTSNPEYSAALQAVARKMGLPERYVVGWPVCNSQCRNWRLVRPLASTTHVPGRRKRPQLHKG